MHPLIENKRPELKELAKRYGVRSMSVFGSMARGDATDLSDVDLLVEPGRLLSGFDLGELLMDAQDLLGRKVDLVTINALHPLMRDRILRESQQI